MNHGLRKRCEQFAIRGVYENAILGVPLDGYGKGRTGFLDGFDDAISRDG